MYSLQAKEGNTQITRIPKVELLDSRNCQEWDQFVLNHPNGTFFHLSDWQMIYQSYFKLETFFLLSRTHGKISGVLPLARVKSRLFSNALISTPFVVYGGVLASSPRDVELLLREAQYLAQRLKVDYLELRQIDDDISQGDKQSLYVTFSQSLDPDSDKNFKAIPRKQRAMIRKAFKQNLSFQVNQDVRTFYQVYSESMRNLGSPVQSIRYFHYLVDVFKDKVDILTIYQDQRPLCSVLSFYYHDQVLPYFGGGKKEARQTYAHDLMYWSLMEHALTRGVKVFDFGRSKIDSGSYRFKKHWGFEPQPLHYRTLPVMKQEKPNINPTNPRYRKKIALWKKLPLAMANTLGPFLARRIG